MESSAVFSCFSTHLASHSANSVGSDTTGCSLVSSVVFMLSKKSVGNAIEFCGLARGANCLCFNGACARGCWRLSISVRDDPDGDLLRNKPTDGLVAGVLDALMLLGDRGSGGDAAPCAPPTRVFITL